MRRFRAGPSPGPLRAWISVVALQALLVAGGEAALITGEEDGERVEKIVGEAPVEAHEERAEYFVWMSGGVLAFAAAALVVPIRFAGPLTGSSLGLMVVVAVLAVRTGKAGGELVYRRGAAPAFGAGAAPPGASPPAGEAGRREHDRSEHDRREHAVSARHIWIIAQPPGAVAECGACLDYMMAVLPLHEVLVKVLTGSGECAKVDWVFLGLNMPTWVLVSLVVVGTWGLAVNWAGRRSG